MQLLSSPRIHFQLIEACPASQLSAGEWSPLALQRDCHGANGTRHRTKEGGFGEVEWKKWLDPASLVVGEAIVEPLARLGNGWKAVARW